MLMAEAMGVPTPMAFSRYHFKKLKCYQFFSSFVALIAGCGFLRWKDCRGHHSRRHLVRQIVPRHILERFRWTSLHALGRSVTEKALGGLVLVLVEAHHLPGARSLAHLTADAFVRIHDPGIGWRLDHDRIIGAGVGTGHRVRTLFAEILDDQSVPPVSQGTGFGVEPFGSILEVAAHLDPGHGGRRLSVVELRTGQLTAPATDAPCGIRDHKAFCLIHDNQRHLLSALGSEGDQSGDSDHGDPAQFEEAPSSHGLVETQEIQGLFEGLTVFVLPMHIPSFTGADEVPQNPPPVPLYKGGCFRPF
jgi:hypothetical protein